MTSVLVNELKTATRVASVEHRKLSSVGASIISLEVMYHPIPDGGITFRLAKDIPCPLTHASPARTRFTCHVLNRVRGDRYESSDCIIKSMTVCIAMRTFGVNEERCNRVTPSFMVIPSHNILYVCKDYRYCFVPVL